MLKPRSKLVFGTILLVGLIASITWYGVNGWGATAPLLPSGPRQGEVQFRESPTSIPPSKAERVVAAAQRQVASTQEQVTSHGPGDPGKTLCVTDTNGRPVSGADVRSLQDMRVFSAGDQWDPLQPLSSPLMSTGSEGEVETTSLGPGRYVCAADGYIPVSFFQGETRAARSIVLHEARGRRLVVSDTSGAPIPGARLWVLIEAIGWATTLPGDAFVEAARADSQGVLTLWRTLSRDALAVVVHDGYSPCFVSLPDPDSEEASEVVLLEGASIGGRVVNADNVGGRYAIRAESEQYSVPSSRHLPTAPVATDGTFLMSGLARGLQWTLVPCIRVGGEWQAAGESVTVDAPSMGVDLWLAESFAISVRAVDASGAPLRATILSSLMPAVGLADAADPTCIVSADGTTTWPRLPWPFHPALTAKPELWLSCPGYARTRLGKAALRSGAVLDLGEVVMNAAEAWQLEVVDAVTGDPIGKATVRFVPDEVAESHEYSHALLQESVTNASGSTQFVCPGNTMGFVHVTADGWMEHRERHENSNCGDTRIAMHRPALLSIICQEANGAPVAKTPLQWRPARSQFWQALSADSDGVAQLEVAPGDLRVRHAPGALSGRTASGAVFELDVHREAEGQPRPSQEVAVDGLRAGEHRTVELIVPAMSDLGVHVTLDGVPARGSKLVGIPGTRLDIVDNDLWGSLDLPKAVVPEDGVVHLYGMPIGKIMLSAILPETNFVAYQAISVLRPFSGLVHFAIETSPLTVTVRGRDGEPLPGVEVALRQMSFQNGIRVPLMRSKTPGGAIQTEGRVERIAVATTDENGEARFEHVPVKGHFVVSARDAGRFPLLPSVSLFADDRHALLEVGRGAALRLHLVWANDGRLGSNVEFVLRGDELPQQLLGVADDNGDILVPGLAPGKYRVGISVGERWFDIALEAGEEHEETIILK